VLALALLLCTTALTCGAPDGGSRSAVEASAGQSAGRITFGIVADEKTPEDAARRDYKHWNAGGAWNVPSQPIWRLEQPLLDCRVQRAVPTVDAIGFPALELTLDPRDGPAFRTLGQRAAGRRIAVLIDGRVVVTPRVEHPLSTRFQLAGNFSSQDVKLLLEHLQPP
jgi:preprotein translocase subunit SecD